MKKILTLCLSLATGLCVFGQADPVVMRINNQEITRSEFEYNYNKNNSEGVLDKKTLDEYVDLFVNYKLKVMAALDAKYDTITSFQKEFRGYRDQQIRPYLVTSAAEESEALAYYNQMKTSIGATGLVFPAHIFVRMPQKATAEQQQRAKTRIDSIYTAIKGGAAFEELAKKCSEDPATAARGGDLTWIGPSQTLKEFEDVAYTLQKGEMSVPFLSTVGYHIVLMKDRKQLEPFAELKPQIQAFLEQRGLKDKIASAVLDSLVENSKGTLTAEQILDQETERLSATDIELKNLIREYYEGLLLFEVSTREVWNKAEGDEHALERFFKKNKKKYRWEAPHFSGIVYHCRKAEDVKKVKKLLKKTAEDAWVDTLRSVFRTDSVIQIKVKYALFKEGDNAFVDHLIFKKEAPKEVSEFPYTEVYGSKLKKGPQKYQQVRKQVVADYQTVLEEEFVKRLRAKYKVEIYKEVLNTVNKH